MASETQPLRVVQPRVILDRRGRIYEPAVGPRLKFLLVLIFVLFALIGANSVYLVSLKVLNWWTGQELGNWFYLQMLLWHLVIGGVITVPFIVFVAAHLKAALKRPNRAAVRLGLGLMITSMLVLVTGIVMVFQRDLFSTTSPTGQLVYWLHALLPLAVIGFYLAHRMAGPVVKWRYAGVWGGAVAAIVVGFGLMHLQDPRQWNVKGTGDEYFQPSSARTINEKGETGTHFIPEYALTNNDYCLKCHQDIYGTWFHSAHHFSSFNNLPYRQSILDMRKALDAEVKLVAQKREMKEDTAEFKKYRAKRLQATRWCAGCHDPVPFFSGKFDDDNFFRDLEVKLPLDGSKWVDESERLQPTAHAGLTCVSCHGITHINSVKGNGDYTIQEPTPYPFQYSDSKLLQFVNEYLVKAKPDLHKRSMLKTFHRTAEFCQVCHKVSLPFDVNDYKWTRGQNHYDSWHSSGASGFGARSFYHPPNAKKCSECHMPLIDSKDFGNIDGKVHTHLFLGANTALPALRLHFGHRHYYPPVGDEEDVIRQHQEFLKDKKLRVDLFAVREKGEIDGKLHVLRPTLPELVPGESYLVEVVVRNLGVGHEFSQGTVDSNEIWVQAEVSSEGKPLAQNGVLDEYGYLDPWSHTLNAVVLDRHGNRIDRRNAKDIFVPLFNHQVPPSSSQVVHYRLTVPKDQKAPLDIKVAVKYRKFDRIFQDFFMDRRRQAQAGSLLGGSPLDFGGLGSLLGGAARSHALDSRRGPELPVVSICEDHVVLAVQGGSQAQSPTRELPPQWERFNDYGVGLFLAGNEGAEKGLLRQAEEAFQEVTKLRPNDYADGFLNLARVYLKEGRLQDMAAVLDRAKDVQPGYFKTAWLRAELNVRNGRIPEAIADYKAVLGTRIPERGFDFSKDREIRRALGNALFLLAQGEKEGSAEQGAIVKDAIAEFRKVLGIDPEDRDSHLALEKCYRQLGDTKMADHHRAEYEIYQIDDNARSFTVNLFRRKHKWADHAAQSVVIYNLPMPGEPGGPPKAKEAVTTEEKRRKGNGSGTTQE
jgi:tetratricopeptide (TPR) repeat protein